MAMKKNLKISDLEKLTGISHSTIHHYVNYGLLHRPQKSSHTMAYYDDSHVKRLEAIQRIKIDYLRSAKSSRIPLDYIKHRLRESYSLIKQSGRKDENGSVKRGDAATEKRAAIIEATLQMYAHRGYYLTNIRDIAKAVGISPPTFYRYFRDKRELFVETVEYVVRKFKEESRAALKNKKDPTERSIIMFRIFHAHYSKIGEILNQLRSGVIIGDPWAKARLASLYGPDREETAPKFETFCQNRGVNLRVFSKEEDAIRWLRE